MAGNCRSSVEGGSPSPIHTESAQSPPHTLNTHAHAHTLSNSRSVLPQVTVLWPRKTQNHTSPPPFYQFIASPERQPAIILNFSFISWSSLFLVLSFIFLISYFLSLFFLFFFIPFSFILSPFVPFCFSFSALSRVSERVLIPNLSQRSYDASLTLLIKVSSLPDDESSSLTSLRSDMLPGRLIRNLFLYFSSYGVQYYWTAK